MRAPPLKIGIRALLPSGAVPAHQSTLSFMIVLMRFTAESNHCKITGPWSQTVLTSPDDPNVLTEQVQILKFYYFSKVLMHVRQLSLPD